MSVCIVFERETYRREYLVEEEEKGVEREKWG
jgi:hypothetical protein